MRKDLKLAIIIIAFNVSGFAFGVFNSHIPDFFLTMAGVLTAVIAMGIARRWGGKEDV